MIKIKSCYSWYNVYINNTLVLKHIFQKDIDEIIRVLHETNTPYDLDLRG
jgi:hypothetical protein